MTDWPIGRPADWRIVRLAHRDVPRCLHLARDRGWAGEAAKWALLLEVGEGYGVEDDTGRLVGTTILTRYGSDVAAVSMVLVASDLGGRGLGRRLMTHALERAGDATVALYATEYGRPLYTRLGFTAVATAVTHLGVHRDGATENAPAEDDTPVVPAGPQDLAGIAALDAEVFGADRSVVLARFFTFAEHVRLVRRDGAVHGYAAAWRNIDTIVVGPVVARDDATARALIGDIARRVSDPIRLDLDDRHPDMWAWATGRGLRARSSATVMVRAGRGSYPGRPEHSYTPAMQALC